MTTLVLGASGATGQLLVKQLLKNGESVRIIVRERGKVPDEIINNENLSVIRASIHEMGDDDLANHLKGCDAIASCLGHNLTLKGLFGKPRRLVTDVAQKVCNAIKESNPERPIKYVLMNTAGNSNRDLNEPTSFKYKLVIGLCRLLLPPHVDNEKASDFLRIRIGKKSSQIEWSVVRPDTLIDKQEVSAYEEHISPIRDAIFNPGKTSRINVAHFMAALITDSNLWEKWKSQMPVIYNVEK